MKLIFIILAFLLGALLFKWYIKNGEKSDVQIKPKPPLQEIYIDENGPPPLTEEEFQKLKDELKKQKIQELQNELQKWENK